MTANRLAMAIVNTNEKAAEAAALCTPGMARVRLLQFSARIWTDERPACRLPARPGLHPSVLEIDSCTLRLGLSFTRWRENHIRHGIDPDKVIAHAFDACNVLCRNHDGLTLPFVGERAPEF